MSRSTSVRTISTLLLAATLPVLAADSLQVKTGLWETSVTTSMGGMSIPADALAKMPPAQRAQMEQMMKQMGAGAPHSVKEKACITEKDLQQGAFRPDAAGDQRSCKYTQVSSTARRQEWTFQCANPEGAANGRMVIDAPDNTHVQGTVDVTSPRANVNIKISSQWLSASCPAAEKD